MSQSAATPPLLPTRSHWLAVATLAHTHPRLIRGTTKKEVVADPRIAFERCHGSGANHNVVNPAKLAAANLGILRAQKGVNPAPLWQSLFDRYPHMLPVGPNLLSIPNDEALRRRISRFHPDR